MMCLNKKKSVVYVSFIETSRTILKFMRTTSSSISSTQSTRQRKWVNHLDYGWVELVLIMKIKNMTQISFELMKVSPNNKMTLGTMIKKPTSETILQK
jgi:hypothetical protein